MSAAPHPWVEIIDRRISRRELIANAIRIAVIALALFGLLVH